MFQDFYKEMFGLAVIGSNQVFAWRPGFDKNNLGRWVKQGLLIKLRNGFYTFPEYLNQPSFSLYVANRIYRPSYVSLHTALSFYGLIPEAIASFTSVSSRKTKSFSNEFGSFVYQTIHSKLMFGYDSMPYDSGKTILIAKPEKAILDLLYLYPFYDSAEEMAELRFDDELFDELVDTDLLWSYAKRFNNKALEHRTGLLLNVYQLCYK